MRNINKIKFDKKQFAWFWFLFSFSLIAVAWGFGYWYLTSDKYAHARVFLERQTERQQIAWNAITDANKIAISIYFETSVQKPEVARLLNVANHGTPSQKDAARASLHKLLLTLYEKFLSINVDQFHFQDRENNSFLRFHLPQTYGDSLNSTRPSIVHVNRYKKAVFGFETGKVALSFRNVFPIEYNKEHIGSVDISQDFEALKNKMESLHKHNEYLLAVKTNEAIPKLFDKEKLRHIKVNMGDDWLIENLRDGKVTISQRAIKLMQIAAKDATFLAAIKNTTAFTHAIDDDDNKYMITAIPIMDTEGKYSALLISFAAAPELQTIESDHAKLIAYLSFILGVLFLTINWIVHIRKKMDAGKRKLAAVTQTMGEGLYILNTDGEIEYINESAESILGFSSAECMGKTAHYLLHHHSQNGEMELHECKIHQSIKELKKYTGIEYFSRKNGDIFAADIISSPLIEKGVFVGSVTVFRDIADRIKLEDELKALNEELGQKIESEVSKRLESENSFGTVFTKSPEGMIKLSGSGEFLECNPSAAAILSYSVDELKHKTIMDISPEMQNEYSIFSNNAALMFLEKAINGETQYLEWTHLTKNGDHKPLAIMLAPMVWRGQNVILCTWRDMTELKKLQREKEVSQAFMIQQNKLAEMGTMIGAIAHQWKQPLNALWIVIQDIGVSYEYGELNKDTIAKFKRLAGEQVAFMNQTIEDFRNFYKPSKSATVFSLAKSINSIVDIFKKQLAKDSINLIVSIDDAITITGYESEFKQVVLNIVNNAKDALIAKEIGEKNIEIAAVIESGKAVIRIADNAGGIDEKILKSNKLFEPYFSTKGESGTGIGLSLSKTIIEQKMGGKLTAHNKNNGAEFVIELTVSPKESIEA